MPGTLLLLYRDGAREVKLMERDLPSPPLGARPADRRGLEQTSLDPLPEVLDNPPGDPRLYVFTNHPVAWDV